MCLCVALISLPLHLLLSCWCTCSCLCSLVDAPARTCSCLVDIKVSHQALTSCRLLLLSLAHVCNRMNLLPIFLRKEEVQDELVCCSMRCTACQQGTCAP
jgi:hypothetical protein